MEFVEGPTLADRIAQGPIPLDEALPIARQIADALEAAHERGIIHRDLKPANIKVTADGAVKVLDFGLAKALDPDGARHRRRRPAQPTITTPAMTGAGMILGTAAYMSPEQAKGRAVDKRERRVGVRLRALRDADRPRALSTARTSPIPSQRSCALNPIGMPSRWMRHRRFVCCSNAVSRKIVAPASRT